MANTAADKFIEGLTEYVESQNEYGDYHDLSSGEAIDILKDYESDANWRISDIIQYAMITDDFSYGDDQFLIVRFTSRD